MKDVTVGGVRVSAIGLGTWQFGSGEWGYGPGYARTTAPALVRRALELGITLIDTAEVYGRGTSELIVGSALREAGRDALVATKFSPILPVASVMVEHAARSRARLNVPAIDLYQLHFANLVAGPPPGGRAAASARPRDRSPCRRQQPFAEAVARDRAGARATRPVEPGRVQPCPVGRAERPRAVRGRERSARHRLLAAGPGPARREPEAAPEGARLVRRAMGAPSWKRVAPIRALIAEVAAAHDATMAQVALAWLIAQPNVVAIPGARTVAQLEENVRAADLDLTGDDLDRLTTVATSLARKGRSWR